MRVLFLFIIQITLISSSLAQSKTEEDVLTAFTNAKKGVYWALTNIPEKKQKIENDLISEDKLIASVKLEKEVNGIKITSTGFYISNEVTIKIYKSTENLIKEGYLVEQKEGEPDPDSEKNE